MHIVSQYQSIVKGHSRLHFPMEVFPNIFFFRVGDGVAIIECWQALERSSLKMAIN